MRLVIIHVHSGERKELEILYAERNWKLDLHWPMNGRYSFDLKINRLRFSARGKRILEWRAENLEEAIKIWKQMLNPMLREVKEESKAPGIHGCKSELEKEILLSNMRK